MYIPTPRLTRLTPQRTASATPGLGFPAGTNLTSGTLVPQALRTPHSTMTALKTPLVDYSDSDSDSQPPSKPLSTLPPLPSRFHDIYAVAPRIGNQDDPALHGGRKRSIPHVSGNWPTHVFVEWHLSRLEFDLLDDVYTAVAAIAKESGVKLETHLKSELGSELPLHLSLSRPNVLATLQRDGFMELLEERVEKARIKPFEVGFTGFEWVCNSDRTRWFFVLKVEKGELPRLLQIADRTFEVFGQPVLGGGGFHVSLAWCLREPGKAVVERVEEVLMGVGGCGRRVVDEVGMRVEAVKVKIGNAVHTVEVKGRREEGSCKKRRLSYS